MESKYKMYLIGWQIVYLICNICIYELFYLLKVLENYYILKLYDINFCLYVNYYLFDDSICIYLI